VSGSAAVRGALERVLGGYDLDDAEMTAALEEILAGDADAAAVAGLLVALRMKGESVGELVSAARVLRAHAVRVPGAPRAAIDTCGTGGDGAGTLNVSTAAGLVAAACGVPVAKHGNRAVSGRVGGADVLEALGVRLELPPAALGECLRTVGFAFLFAPALHPAMRHAAPARRALGVRTLFNLLGPLANPAGVRRQVVGVFARRWVVPVAEALLALGAERAWVVHGAGGLDELALEGENAVAEVADGGVRTFGVTAAETGLAPAPAAALAAGSVAQAAACIRGVLAGEPGPARDVVCLNAGAALLVAGATADLPDGVARAAAALDAGAAASVLERLVAFTMARAEAP
jgi:anthranilate phosphoribosyltransferase